MCAKEEGAGKKEVRERKKDEGEEDEREGKGRMGRRRGDGRREGGLTRGNTILKQVRSVTLIAVLQVL